MILIYIKETNQNHEFSQTKFSKPYFTDLFLEFRRYFLFIKNNSDFKHKFIHPEIWIRNKIFIHLLLHLLYNFVNIRNLELFVLFSLSAFFNLFDTLILFYRFILFGRLNLFDRLIITIIGLSFCDYLLMITLFNDKYSRFIRLSTWGIISLITNCFLSSGLVFHHFFLLYSLFFTLI